MNFEHHTAHAEAKPLSTPSDPWFESNRVATNYAMRVPVIAAGNGN